MEHEIYGNIVAQQGGEHIKKIIRKTCRFSLIQLPDYCTAYKDENGQFMVERTVALELVNKWNYQTSKYKYWI
jgi:hypothetical protein